MLCSGFKFDLRIYVLITSIDPLIFYVYHEGLGRFATVQYQSPTAENIKVATMHLTNFSINCLSETFVDTDGTVGAV